MYGNGRVYFTEFIAATLESEGKIKDDRIADAFNRIDEWKTGFLSKGVSNIGILVLIVRC